MEGGCNSAGKDRLSSQAKGMEACREAHGVGFSSLGFRADPWNKKLDPSTGLLEIPR